MERTYQWKNREVFLLLLILGILEWMGRRVAISYSPEMVTLILRIVDILVILGFLKIYKKTVYSLGWGNWRRGVKWGIGATLILFLIFILLTLPPFPGKKYILLLRIPLTPLYILLYTTFPILAEEMVFRGFLYQYLRERAGVLNSVLLTSFLFAFLHGYTFPFFFLPLAGGVVFSLLRERTDSLWAPLVFHSLGNLQFIIIPHFLL